MPTETQHPEQRVAALQSDLNTKDNQIDALTFSDNDRELSRRDWLEAAQAAEKRVEVLEGRLAERDALLHRWVGNFGHLGGCATPLRDETKAALSASAERGSRSSHLEVGPCTAQAHRIDKLFDAAMSGSAKPSDECAHSYANKAGCPECGEEFDRGKPAPVERDERAEFEQAFVVQEGLYFSAERNEYRSMNGRSIEYTDAKDLNLRLQGWQARAALDKATEGASHE
ncbi:hypothetical protein [Pseudomonas phage PseuP_224]|nr:hypothetical protein [Pseudomonas phage PseuP_224]